MSLVEMDLLLLVGAKIISDFKIYWAQFNNPLLVFYDTTPPYYEGIAIMEIYTLETKHDQSSWQFNASLTLQKVTSQGLL